MFWFIILLAGFFPMNLAFARGGENSGGGGDSIVCATLNGEKVFLADTFELFYDKNFPSLDLNPEVIEQYFIHYLEDQNPNLKSKLFRALQSLTFKPVKNVKEFDDDFITGVPDNCHKKQLAFQSIEQKTVYYNISLYFKLSLVERALLRVHEALIQLRSHPGNTTPIRNLVQSNYASSVNSPLIRMAAEKFKKILETDETKRANLFVWAALDTCFKMQLKGCRKGSGIYEFLDARFEGACGEYGSRCDRDFKSIFEFKLSAMGILQNSIPDPLWRKEIHADNRAWIVFTFLPHSLGLISK